MNPFIVVIMLTGIGTIAFVQNIFGWEAFFLAVGLIVAAGFWMEWRNKRRRDAEFYDQHFSDADRQHGMGDMEETPRLRGDTGPETGVAQIGRRKNGGDENPPPANRDYFG